MKPVMKIFRPVTGQCFDYMDLQGNTYQRQKDNPVVPFQLRATYTARDESQDHYGNYTARRVLLVDDSVIPLVLNCLTYQCNVY